MAGEGDDDTVLYGNYHTGMVISRRRGGLWRCISSGCPARVKPQRTFMRTHPLILSLHTRWQQNVSPLNNFGIAETIVIIA